MDQIGAAVLFAQAVVDRAGVEQHGAAIAQGIGDNKEFVGGQIENDEAVAFGERIRRLCDVVALLEPHLGEREMLVEKLAGGVVVLDRKPRAVDAVIVGRLRNQRQCRFDAGMTEIADADLDRIGRERMGRHHAQANRADQHPDHGVSFGPPSVENFS